MRFSVSGKIEFKKNDGTFLGERTFKTEPFIEATDEHNAKIVYIDWLYFFNNGVYKVSDDGKTEYKKVVVWTSRYAGNCEADILTNIYAKTQDVIAHLTVTSATRGEYDETFQEGEGYLFEVGQFNSDKYYPPNGSYWKTKARVDLILDVKRYHNDDDIDAYMEKYSKSVKAYDNLDKMCNDELLGTNTYTHTLDRTDIKPIDDVTPRMCYMYRPLDDDETAEELNDLRIKLENTQKQLEEVYKHLKEQRNYRK